MTKLISQNPPRTRVKLQCPEQSITDPDENRHYTMASIKARLEKGIVPPLTDDAFYSLQPLKYTNLQDALDFQQTVVRQFEALPSELRKKMGNNIYNFEPFLQDPENLTILQEYGLVQTKDATNSDVLHGIKELGSKMSPPKPQEKP